MAYVLSDLVVDLSIRHPKSQAIRAEGATGVNSHCSWLVVSVVVVVLGNNTNFKQIYVVVVVFANCEKCEDR